MALILMFLAAFKMAYVPQKPGQKLDINKTIVQSVNENTDKEKKEDGK